MSDYQPIPTTHNFKDLTNKRFGRLLVLGYLGSTRGKGKNYIQQWQCICDCGEKPVCRGDALRSGNTNSCGCFSRERASEGNSTHKLSKHPLYGRWRGMMERCYYEKHKNFKHYGGRGIKVCERWHDVRNYIADLDPLPFPSAQLDRKEVNGDYTPDNCQWRTRRVNARNKRNTVLIEFQGKNQTLVDWSNELNIPHSTLHNRLKRGLPLEQVFDQNPDELARVTRPDLQAFAEGLNYLRYVLAERDAENDLENVANPSHAVYVNAQLVLRWVESTLDE